MIEAVVAVGLVAIGVGSALAGAAAIERETAAEQRGALTASAQNVLTDLRAATVYDSAELAALAGKSVDFDLPEPLAQGSTAPVHVRTHVSRTADGMMRAIVTVRDARGREVTLDSTLAVEAPAPGSVVPAQLPAPAATP